MIGKAQMDRLKSIVPVAVVLLLAAMGFFALSHLLREVHMHDIRAAWAQVGVLHLLAAAGLTAISYLALTLYDVLALRAIDRPLPYRVAALASFTSYTLSHNLGLALFTGGSARYRIYSAHGLGAGDVGRVVAIAGLTFWGGVFTLAGAMLALFPGGPGFADFAPSPWVWRASGIALLALIIGALAWSGPSGRTVRIWKWDLRIPGYRTAFAQLGVATVDLMAASAALLVLVPGASLADWPVFFIGYILAIIAVLVTHVPGGLGVFEAVIVAALPGTPRPELIAALLGYRLVYYILPLLIAGVIIAVQEGTRWRRPMAATLHGAQTIASGVAPTLVAALVFLGGMVLLVSGALPAEHDRMAALAAILPLPLVEISHLAGSVVGAALLLVSAGLYRRLDGAAWLTGLLLLIGALVSLAKGLDYEEAILMLLLAGVLRWTRGAFYRRTRLTQEVLTPSWLASVALMIGLPIWVGFFAYKRVPYSTDLFWRFSEHGDASRFLRASLGVGLALAALAVWRLLRPAPVAGPGLASLEPPQGEAMALTRRTDANLAYTGDKRFLCSTSGRAFVMYQVRGASWIVMGDPVGDPAEWSELLWQLREGADAAQGRLLLYQISLQALPGAIDLGLQIVKYGEEARVDLAAFTLDTPAAKPLRYAVRRAEKEGARFAIIARDELAAHLPRLQEISESWLREKGHREKGFSVGRFDPAYLARFDCAVVLREEKIVAFANIWATQDHSELSIDLMRHDADMPYGTMDYLFVRLMQWGHGQGYRWFTLGLAPLSGLEARRLAPLWARLGALLYHHGQALYGFEGLRSYKEKFSPVWEPRFIAGPQGPALARALFDLQALIGGK